MAHEQLPLKYRPQRFNDLVGQPVLTRYCTNLIKSGPVPKNLIFHGDWGSGKTSSARIYARALNCLAITDEGEPCNQCDNCKAFFAEAFPDYLEQDAASAGSKETIKQIIDLAKTPPLHGRFRVVLLDEAHQMSKQAFDALLKLLEEPPPYLVLLFSTTELNKVRDAIKSRCQSLEVSALDNVTATSYLEKICAWESIPVKDKAALGLIAHLSQGHPRDLLKNLEQAAFFGEVTTDNVKALFSLGFIDNVIEFWNAMVQANNQSAVHATLAHWIDTPQNILEVIRESFLYIIYKGVFTNSASINPLFDLIQPADLQRIVARLRALLPNDANSASALIRVFDEKLNASSVNTLFALQLSLLHLYTFLHEGGGSVRTFGQPTVKVAGSAAPIPRQGGGRRFITNPTLDQAPITSDLDTAPPKPEPAPVATPTPASPKPLYAHNLLGAGFRPVQPDDGVDIITT